MIFHSYFLLFSFIQFVNNFSNWIAEKAHYYSLTNQKWRNDKYKPISNLINVQTMLKKSSKLNITRLIFKKIQFFVIHKIFSESAKNAYYYSLTNQKWRSHKCKPISNLKYVQTMVNKSSKSNIRELIFEKIQFFSFIKFFWKY